MRLNGQKIIAIRRRFDFLSMRLRAVIRPAVPKQTSDLARCKEKEKEKNNVGHRPLRCTVRNRRQDAYCVSRAVGKTTTINGRARDTQIS